MAFIEYPKHLGHKKHAHHKVVKNRDEEDAARADGWDDHANVEAAKQAEQQEKAAGADAAASKPSATELGGAPLSVDPSTVDDPSAAIIEDAADEEGKRGKRKR